MPKQIGHKVVTAVKIAQEQSVMKCLLVIAFISVYI